MSLTPDLVILIVAYRGRAFLPECLNALLNADSAGLTSRIVVVENASADGSVEWLRESYPQVEVLELAENCGFAGGNNRGWDWAAERFPTVKYLALVNQDVTVDVNWLRPLIAALDEDESLACVQPTVLLDPERSTINTLGTRSHYLGFGFPIGYREPLAALTTNTQRVDSVSGAACVMRADVVRRFGLFDARLFMYLEDVEWGWKLRLAGFDHAWIGESHVFHQYTFRPELPFYYYLERNRLWLLFVYLRWRTLLVLLPAIMFMECGQLGFATLKRRLLDKLRSYAYFLRTSTWQALATRRREIQSLRQLSDREFMARFTGQIESPELERIWLVKWIANPIFNAYWKIVKRLIAW